MARVRSAFRARAGAAGAATSGGLQSAVYRVRSSTIRSQEGALHRPPSIRSPHHRLSRRHCWKFNPRLPHVRAFGEFLKAQQDSLAAEIGTTAIYNFKFASNAFAAMLTPKQVWRLQRHPDVALVRRSGVAKRLGMPSTSFLDLQRTAWKQAGGVGSAGDGVVVGVIDTGIWPEHKMFLDDGSFTKPGSWAGTCDATSDFPASLCTGKLVGARTFYTGYEAEVGARDFTDDYDSPRDSDSHGTWCAGAAVGNSGVTLVTPYGTNLGTYSGVAPRASLAVYKVFWKTQGSSSASFTDIEAAVDQAMADGANVLSLSLGALDPSMTYFDDVAYLQANVAGVTVVYAAGNSGRPPGNLLFPYIFRSVSNFSPFYLTVGASTINKARTLYGRKAAPRTTAASTTTHSTAAALLPATALDDTTSSSGSSGISSSSSSSSDLDEHQAAAVRAVVAMQEARTATPAFPAAAAGSSLAGDTDYPIAGPVDGTTSTSSSSNNSTALASELVHSLQEEGMVVVGNWPALHSTPVLLAATAALPGASSTEPARLCLPGSLAAAAVRGNVVVCASGGSTVGEKVAVVAAAGGRAVVVSGVEVSGEEEGGHEMPCTLEGSASNCSASSSSTVGNNSSSSSGGSSSDSSSVSGTGSLGSVSSVSSGGGSMESMLSGSEAWAVPVMLVDHDDSAAMFALINALTAKNTGKKGGRRATTLSILDIFNYMKGPVVATFSSTGPLTPMTARNRGPYPTNHVLKPDIIAPGVNLYSAAPGTSPNNAQMLSGTSMATPHVAGLAALVIQAHPTWTPAQVMSAMMTTARTHNSAGTPIFHASATRASPWHLGSGHVNPEKMLDPGLTYNAVEKDYKNFLAGRKMRWAKAMFPSDSLSALKAYQLNRPCISVQGLRNTVVIVRRVTNVATSTSTYRAKVKQPFGVAVKVKPRKFTIAPGATQVFKVTLTLQLPWKLFRFGSLWWLDGKGHSHSKTYRFACLNATLRHMPPSPAISMESFACPRLPSPRAMLRANGFAPSAVLASNSSAPPSYNFRARSLPPSAHSLSLPPSRALASPFAEPPVGPALSSARSSASPCPGSHPCAHRSAAHQFAHSFAQGGAEAVASPDACARALVPRAGTETSAGANSSGDDRELSRRRSSPVAGESQPLQSQTTVVAAAVAEPVAYEPQLGDRVIGVVTRAAGDGGLDIDIGARLLARVPARDAVALCALGESGGGGGTEDYDWLVRGGIGKGLRG
ncbi:unnamed protein product [Closterium sp. Yama58-4]|nr:unnamed protein product [Closterium sp. Yama58-4]